MSINRKERVMLWGSFGYVHLGSRKHLSHAEAVLEKEKTKINIFNVHFTFHIIVILVIIFIIIIIFIIFVLDYGLIILHKMPIKLSCPTKKRWSILDNVLNDNSSERIYLLCFTAKHQHKVNNYSRKGHN